MVITRVEVPKAINVQLFIFWQDRDIVGGFYALAAKTRRERRKTAAGSSCRVEEAPE